MCATDLVSRCVYMCVYLCVYVCMCVCMCVCVWVYVYMCMCIAICMCAYDCLSENQPRLHLSICQGTPFKTFSQRILN